MSERPKILIISGPTASGKTEFAIELAKRMNGAIISGDSMQVYKGLDIGTAKATLKEMSGIPHYLIDVCYPDMTYSVADFQKDARCAIAEVIKRGQVPIVVGGSGLYIQSLVFDYVFDTIESLDYDQYRTLTNAQLSEKLRILDKKTYEQIDKKNRRRLLHAIALAEQTDQSKAQREANGNTRSLYDFFAIALMPDREQLYERINRRVEKMIAAGLVAEVRFFNQKFTLTPQIKQAIGYRETLAYQRGEYMNENEYNAAIAQNTRRFAKRQVTWLRNQRIAYQLINTDDEIRDAHAQIEQFLQK